jgi:hypothetical protein
LDLAEPRTGIGDQQLLVGVVPHWHLQVEGAPLHRADAVAHGRIDLRRVARRPVDPEAHVQLGRRIEVAAPDRRVLGGAEVTHRLRPFVVGQARPDEDERRDPLRRRQRDLERDPAAERRADQRRRADPGGIHDGEQIAGVRVPLRGQR